MFFHILMFLMRFSITPDILQTLNWWQKKFKRQGKQQQAVAKAQREAEENLKQQMDAVRARLEEHIASQQVSGQEEEPRPSPEMQGAQEEAARKDCRPIKEMLNDLDKSSQKSCRQPLSPEWVSCTPLQEPGKEKQQQKWWFPGNETLMAKRTIQETPENMPHLDPRSSESSSSCSSSSSDWWAPENEEVMEHMTVLQMLQNMPCLEPASQQVSGQEEEPRPSPEMQGAQEEAARKDCRPIKEMLNDLDKSSQKSCRQPLSPEWVSCTPLQELGKEKQQQKWWFPGNETLMAKRTIQETPENMPHLDPRSSESSSSCSSSSSDWWAPENEEVMEHMTVLQMLQNMLCLEPASQQVSGQEEEPRPSPEMQGAQEEAARKDCRPIKEMLNDLDKSSRKSCRQPLSPEWASCTSLQELGKEEQQQKWWLPGNEALMAKMTIQEMLENMPHLDRWSSESSSSCRSSSLDWWAPGNESMMEHMTVLEMLQNMPCLEPLSSCDSQQSSSSSSLEEPAKAMSQEPTAVQETLAATPPLQHVGSLPCLSSLTPPSLARKKWRWWPLVRRERR